MPWSKQDYPDSFKNLDRDVRNKAIEIANALLREDYDEGRAISIALSQAKKTVHGDGEQPVYEIRPHDDGWQLKKKNSKKAILIEETKADLMQEAKRYVNKHDGLLNIYTADGDLEETLYKDR
ncbi:MAG TPA: DUF2188 domain-containing protein [Planococcus sp. (in: firmicutes)]|nr:DUF2188 domain-containing protein [Planococcus sp. (in: firmicutes)]